MSHQKSLAAPNLLAPSSNHALHHLAEQPHSLDKSHHQIMANLPPGAQLPVPSDLLASLNPQYLATHSTQLAQLGFPLFNILAPFSKQVFPSNSTHLFPMNAQYQLPPAWMQLPQTPPPKTPPTSKKLPPKSPTRDKHSPMHNYIQNELEMSSAEAREIREIASATCLKAQEDFNMSACTDDMAIALTLCCSATTRLSSVIDDPPMDWDDEIMHQLRMTRKRYSERWRGLYRMFILKKISAQPPSPIPDDAGKKTKVQLNQYIQVSTDVVLKKTPKKSVTKPLKSILKKPAKKYSDAAGVESRSNLSVSSLSLSSCSLGTLSASNSSLSVSFPPLLRETGTQTSPINFKQTPDKHNYNNNNFPSISPLKHYTLPTEPLLPIRRSSTMIEATTPTSSLFKSLQLSIQSNTEALAANNCLITAPTSPREIKNKENLPPSYKQTYSTFQRSYSASVKSPMKQTPHPPQEPLQSKNLPLKRSTCFTPPPPRRFSPEEDTRITASSQKWTHLCTEV